MEVDDNSVLMVDDPKGILDPHLRPNPIHSLNIIIIIIIYIIIMLNWGSSSPNPDTEVPKQTLNNFNFNRRVQWYVL